MTYKVFLFNLSHRLKIKMSKIVLKKINGLKEKMINNTAPKRN